jgi:taurine dioxygenase
MLHFLLDWLKRPKFMVHHQWDAGGIAVWDNRSTQHYAVADYWPHHRLSQRVTCDTPSPQAATRHLPKGRRVRAA